MDRREFLISTGGAAVAASATTAVVTGTVAGSAQGVAAPAITGGVKPLRLAMPWLDNGRGFGDSARRLARRIETLTAGRYRIDMSAAAAADADLHHGSAHHYAAHHPAFAYFAGLPGPKALSAADFAAWLTVGGGQMLWDDLAAGAGVKPLLAGHTGRKPPLWSREPLEGLAGRKIFAAGLGADVARALGAEAVSSIASGDVAMALASGSVDVAEWGGWLASLSAGLPASAGFATGDGINAGGTALALNVKLSLWETLSDSDRAIFSAAALEEFHVASAEARAHETIAYRTIAALGVATRALPADLTEALPRVSDAIIAHVAAQDAKAARIDQSYMAFRSTLVPSATPSSGVV